MTKQALRDEAERAVDRITDAEAYIRLAMTQHLTEAERGHLEEALRVLAEVRGTLVNRLVLAR